MLNVLKNVNEEVNRNTQYVSDVDQYAKDDFWNEAQGKGDCEDYAIAKKVQLMKKGFKQEDLRFATCWVEKNLGYHAVLIVSIPEGDYMLDNRQLFPVPVSEIKDLGYTMDRIQRVGGQPQWVRWVGVDGAK